MMRYTWFFTALLLLNMAPVHAEEVLREKLRASIFDGASDALGLANKESASVLAPETYRRAAEEYKKAQKAFDDGTDLNKVRVMLANANGLFTQAQQNAQAVAVVVKDAFQARQDALAEDAEDSNFNRDVRPVV